MSERFLDYLRRERDRLEAAIARARSQPAPDRLHIARLARLSRAVQRQIDAWMSDGLAKAA